MIRIKFLILILWLIHQSDSQLPDCNNEQKRMFEFISTRLREARVRDDRWDYHDDDTDLNTDGSRGGGRVRHRLSFHQVCFHIDDNTKIEYVNARIKRSDMAANKGTGVFDDAKNHLQENFKICGSDELGHIIPNSWSGQGYIGNMFIQNSNLNRQIWNEVCREVSVYVNASSKEATDEYRSVFFTMLFEYNDRLFPHRPSTYYYKFQLQNKNGVHRFIYGLQENEHHGNARIHKCWMGKRTEFYDINVLNDVYFQKRSCAVQPGYPTNYGPVIPSSSNNG